jgi:hypothetical protein
MTFRILRTLFAIPVLACTGAKVESRDSAASVGEATTSVNGGAVIPPATDTVATPSAASTSLRDSAFGPVLQVDEKTGKVSPLTPDSTKKTSPRR